ncbi:hypothetical protein JCM10207_002272 [Rhodosporidiobolus poonsookiae]
MPSNPGTTSRHLAPLSIPSSAPVPSSPLASPALDNDERRPLLRPATSYTAADNLKRKSHHISSLLFDHHNAPSPTSDQEPLNSPASPTYSSRARTLSRTRSFLRPGSVRSLRRTQTGYDGDFRTEFEGEGGNGVRSWYDNYHTIDWIHDAIKHSLRLRRLRARKHTDGLRGRLANLWDGAQGWLLVSLIGFCTACVAYCVVSSEMVLFDLKEGYCTKGWTIAKRFCCREVKAAVASTSPARLAVSPFGTYHLRGWSAPASLAEAGEAACENWRTWAQVWQAYTGGSEEAGAVAGYAAYVLLAVGLSTFASLLTITFTASTSVYSSKDSASIPHPGFSPEFVSALNSAAANGNGVSKFGAVDQPSGNEHATIDEVLLLQPRPRKTLYFAAGSGIPEIKTILSGFVIRGYLGSWTLGIKAVGLALSVASGLNLGKEGPFVHLASCIGNILSRFFTKYDKNEGKRREILSAACAAGVAVSFGAPVGGVLFSLEEVSYFFPPRTMLRSFWCAMVAAMTLKLLDPFKSGKIVLFAVTYDRDWHVLELIGFLALAVFGGVYGALFCKANIAWTKHVRQGTFLKTHPIGEVALVTLLTVCLSFYNPFAKMGGTELISALFSECHKDESDAGLCISTPPAALQLMGSIALALVIKASLTVITFGCKLPAGIFIPTLAVGACAGRILGLAVEVAHAKWPYAAVFDACGPRDGEGGPLPFGQACVLPGVWAMIGAAATLAGVTRTTVSLAVSVFELTGTLTYSVPTMLAVLLAKTVADRIEARSIYDLVIEVADLPYLDAKTEYIHDATPSEILDSEAPTISLDVENTVGSLRAQLASLYTDGTASGFPIVALTQDEPAVGRRMFAYLASKELEHGLALAAARGLPDSAPLTFRTASAAARGLSASSLGGTAYASGAVTPSGANSEGMDLSWLTDSAPIVANIRSPMELLHEMFIKLGIRYVVIVDERGLYHGVLEKGRYLRYLQWLERRAEEREKHRGSSSSSASGAGRRGERSFADDQAGDV